jgi:hypothetical protein
LAPTTAARTKSSGGKAAATTRHRGLLTRRLEALSNVVTSNVHQVSQALTVSGAVAVLGNAVARIVFGMSVDTHKHFQLEQPSSSAVHSRCQKAGKQRTPSRRIREEGHSPDDV